jgi:hypothetical protein
LTVNGIDPGGSPKVNSQSQPARDRREPEKSPSGPRPPFAPIVPAVDDDPTILDVLQKCLRGEPYEILTARYGAAGLGIMQYREVDIVIWEKAPPERQAERIRLKVALIEYSPDRVKVGYYGNPPSANGEVHSFSTPVHRYSPDGGP